MASLTDAAPQPAPYPSVRVELGSDGQCTGVPGVNPATTACCVEHDAGGSDGRLLDCAVDANPGIPAAIICGAIFLMALLRPAYNQLQRWGWVK